MIPGFNHNIKHQGRVFHVQTEDSGPKNPHIITHLFVGGNIISSQKTRYEELLSSPDYESRVKELMEEQHKEMLRKLVRGEFDAVGSAPAYYLDGPAPLNIEGQPLSPATTPFVGAAALEGQTNEVTKAPDLPAGEAKASTAVPDRIESLFGELPEERSLDEVILSYLSGAESES
jgi:hypothetical protein